MQTQFESCLLASGNTYNPSLIVLRQKGYDIWLEKHDSSMTWHAKKGDQSFVACTAPELLGLVGLWEQEGKDWNQQEPDLFGELLERLDPEGFKETREAIHRIKKLHGSVGYGKDGRSVFAVSLNLAQAQEAAAADGLAEVLPATDADMAAVRRFKDLATLDLSHTHVADQGLRELSSLKTIGWLGLEGTKVTDAGLKELARLRSLGNLNLASTQITGKTFSELASLSNLRRLDLSAIPGTPYGGLACLTNLEELCLRYGDVTAADLKEIALLVNLRRLKLQDMTADWLKELAKLNKRRTMQLYEARLSESSLSKLQADLPQCKICVW